MLDKNLLRGAGAALHAVEHDDIGAGFYRELDIGTWPRRADLDKYRLLPIGGLAQLGDLDRQIVGPGPIRMAAGAALVDPGRQGPHLGHPIGDLLAEQHAATARLCALANDDLDRLADPQVRGIEAVARGQYLIDEDVRFGTFLLAHPAVAGRRAGADRTRTTAERTLGIGAERTEAHAGDRDRDIQLDRFLGKTSAEGHVGRAALAVAFERVARDRGAEQHQIVEARQWA